MKRAPVLVRVPSQDSETIAPVTIYDAEGRILRVVPGAIFHPPGSADHGRWRERRRRPPEPIRPEIQL